MINPFNSAPAYFVSRPWVIARRSERHGIYMLKIWNRYSFILHIFNILTGLLVVTYFKKAFLSLSPLEIFIGRCGKKLSVYFPWEGTLIFLLGRTKGNKIWQSLELAKYFKLILLYNNWTSFARISIKIIFAMKA